MAPKSKESKSSIPSILEPSLDQITLHLTKVNLIFSNFRSRGGQRRRQNRPVVAVETNPALAALSFPPKERPDAKHHLKFTYGVNAW